MPSRSHHRQNATRPSTRVEAALATATATAIAEASAARRWDVVAQLARHANVVPLAVHARRTT